jgi:hypothetical protein
MFAYAPVAVGDWKQHEVWDGTYTFSDLLDWHEMAQVKRENDIRQREYQKMLEGE